MPPLGARKTSSLTASRPHRRSWLVAKATTWVRKREDDARWSYTRQLPGPGSWEPGTQRLTRPGCWGPLGMMAGPLSCLSSLHGSRSSRLPGLSARSLLSCELSFGAKWERQRSGQEGDSGGQISLHSGHSSLPFLQSSSTCSPLDGELPSTRFLIWFEV